MAPVQICPQAQDSGLMLILSEIKKHRVEEFEFGDHGVPCRSLAV